MDPTELTFIPSTTLPPTCCPSESTSRSRAAVGYQLHEYYVRGEFVPCIAEWREFTGCLALRLERKEDAKVSDTTLSACTAPSQMARVFAASNPKLSALADRLASVLAAIAHMEPTCPTGAGGEDQCRRDNLESKRVAPR